MRHIGKARNDRARPRQIVVGVDDPRGIERAADLGIAPIDRQAIRFDRVRQLLGIVSWLRCVLEGNDEFVVAQKLDLGIPVLLPWAGSMLAMLFIERPGESTRL